MRRNRRAQPHRAPQPLRRARLSALSGAGAISAGANCLHHFRKRIAYHPVARPRGMNIVEEAQNPRPMRRPRRKRVRMQQVIALAQRRDRAPALPAGESSHSPAATSPGKATRNPVRNSTTCFEYRAHDALQTRHRRCIGSLCVHAAQLVDVRLVGDVLVQRAVRLLLPQQKRQIVPRNRNRRLGKIENLACLQLRAPARGPARQKA